MGQTWLRSLFTTDICIALRHPDGFTLPHNLIRETLLREMSALFDYRSLLCLWVSFLFPPVSLNSVKYNRLGNKANEYVYSLNMVHSVMFVMMLISKSQISWYPVLAMYIRGNLLEYSDRISQVFYVCYETEKVNTFSNMQWSVLK